MKSLVLLHFECYCYSTKQRAFDANNNIIDCVENDFKGKSKIHLELYNFINSIYKEKKTAQRRGKIISFLNSAEEATKYNNEVKANAQSNGRTFFTDGFQWDKTKNIAIGMRQTYFKESKELSQNFQQYTDCQLILIERIEKRAQMTFN